MRRKVVIDCDPGQDDAVALLLAFGEAERLDLRAITVVAGNVPLAWTTTNARRVATLGGCTDVPIYAGCGRPLVNPLVTAEHVHGDSGLDGADLPPATVDLSPGHAVDRIIELAHAEDGLALCATGPLTNVAMALVKDPSIAPKLSRIVLMGGAIGHGNVTPSAEFNIYVDPHAARVVFESGVPIVMLGLDVTEQVRPTAERRARIREIGGEVGPIVADLLSFYAERAADGGALHDPVAVGYLLEPELFTGRDCFVEIVTEGPCAGRTVVDWRGRTGRPPNARVIDTVDDEAFFSLLVESLARVG
ncbi:MAG: nucleoside hydrolase [Geminicoccaceae bacterium]|nr:MAG: nucleoside hydrolase [Geminicoccaceae bacterium]